MELRKCRASPASRENETMSDFGGECCACGFVFDVLQFGRELVGMCFISTCSAIYDVKRLSLETDSVDWKRGISRIDAISRSVL